MFNILTGYKVFLSREKETVEDREERTRKRLHQQICEMDARSIGSAVLTLLPFMTRTRTRTRTTHDTHAWWYRLRTIGKMVNTQLRAQNTLLRVRARGRVYWARGKVYWPRGRVCWARGRVNIVFKYEIGRLCWARGNLNVVFKYEICRVRVRVRVS